MPQPFTQKYKIINPKKRLVTQLIDTCLAPGFAIARGLGYQSGRHNQLIDLKSLKKILILRTAYIGDVIMTLPMLKPLKRACPQAEIHMLVPTGAAPLLDHNPFVDRVIPYNAVWFYKQENPNSLGDYKKVLQQIKQEKYDLVIDARGDIRDIFFLAYRSHAKYRLSYGYGGGSYFLTHVVPYPELIHKVDAHLNLLKFMGVPILAEDKMLKVFLTNNECAKAKDKLRQLGVTDSDILIGIHPGGRKPLKSWPIENYTKLADKLCTNVHNKILITGTEDEKPIIEQMVKNMTHKPIVLAGQTGIRELGAIIQQCAIFICNDSAPMHLAAAVGTPTVAIFGPSKSIETSPYGSIHKVVENDYPCRWTCDEDKCYYKDYQDCMKSIEVEQVYQIIRTAINTRTDK